MQESNAVAVAKIANFVKVERRSDKRLISLRGAHGKDGITF
jgi:hypothetical protein